MKWSFGYQWRKFDTSRGVYGQSVTEEFDKFLYSLNITPNDLKNKKVLDAGSGSGNLTAEIAKYAKETVGIDLVEPAKQNKNKFKFIKANLENIDFIEDNYFDYVHCEGVLHHTANPKKAFMNLARVNKNKIYVLMYSKLDPIMILRKIFSTWKLNFSFLHSLSFLITAFYYLPEYILRIIQNRKSISFQDLHLTVFDSLGAKYIQIIPKQEIDKWFREAHYKEIIWFKERIHKIRAAKFS